MHFSVAVFDLDGVIVSTDTFHFEAWKRLFAKRWGIIHTSAAEELTKGCLLYTSPSPRDRG